MCIRDSFDGDGRFIRWNLTGDLYAAVEHLGDRLSLWRDDHVLSWAAASELVPCDDVMLRMGDRETREVVAALGGFEAFNGVTQLNVSMREWSAELMRGFCSIDSLERLVVSDCPADIAATSELFDEVDDRVALTATSRWEMAWDDTSKVSVDESVRPESSYRDDALVRRSVSLALLHLSLIHISEPTRPY